MELKKYHFYIILFLIIVFLLYNTTSLKKSLFTSNVINVSQDSNMLLKYPENANELLPENGFVKPQHKLLELLSNISSGNKIYLQDLVERKSYTNKTIPDEYNTVIIDIMKKMISGINGISDTDFFIKDLENVYFTMDKLGNKRFIVDTFMYDYNNHYTIRINTDIVIYDNVVYINMLDIDPSAINNILNNYDIKYQSNGILSKYDMRINDAESILNKNYKLNNKLINLSSDTSLDVGKTSDITSVFTLDQLVKNYLPSGVPNKNASYFCNKTSDYFDSKGINFINDVSSDCVSNNNASVKYPNVPYNAPGVVTTRVDKNNYDWMKNPVASGNILYSHGF